MPFVPLLHRLLPSPPTWGINIPEYFQCDDCTHLSLCHSWYDLVSGRKECQNSPQAEHYRNQLKQMIGYYRNLWHGKSWGSVSDGFPVYFTQLPSWNPAKISQWKVRSLHGLSAARVCGWYLKNFTIPEWLSP